MAKTAAAAIILPIAFAAACGRRPAESRVKSVEAKIDGITCPTCVPPLKASLKRQYNASAIDVDDDTDMATVRFAKGESFSAPDFQAAVERVRMRVVTLRLQACGTVETVNGRTWMTAGASRFLLHADRAVPQNGSICADGALDSRADPATFEVSSFTENGK
ncbi:MAG TPA: hypothetical protein VL225_14085 [Vicinamibacterales bacterium]|jgi:hypothetical protein|nr:hypothetical protein [Vicinamibacterales bacterium]